jgi:hypothetical protein
MSDVEEQRRLVRALLSMYPRGFAEGYGFPVTNSPASLFRLLCLSVLLARTEDHRCAIAATRTLREQGCDNPTRMTMWEQPDGTGDVLRGLARTVIQRYNGDLRRQRALARYDPTRERELLRELPGVDDRVVDGFFRDVQLLWREVWPFADSHALIVAQKLGLGRSVAELAALSGTEESERLAWLVGALTRVDLDNRYDEVVATARR